MIFSVVNFPSGDSMSCLFDSMGQLKDATSYPNVTAAHVYELKLNGKTYSDRRESLRNLAIDIQAADNGGLSYMEMYNLQRFFERNARRYGLLTEFHENAIC